MNRSDDSLKEELEKHLDENVQLQEQLARKNTDLHQIHSEWDKHNFFKSFFYIVLQEACKWLIYFISKRKCHLLVLDMYKVLDSCYIVFIVLFFSQADSVANGQRERRVSCERAGGSAGRTTGGAEKRDRQQSWCRHNTHGDHHTRYTLTLQMTVC